MWEVPLLSIISQLYHEVVDTNWSMDGQVEKINSKGKILSDNDCRTADMSTRRRRNFATQKMVVEELKKYPCFNGTSNTYLAMLNSVKPIGTMSHQWIQSMQALRSIRHCNHYAMHYWVKTFGTSLGIMLTDTVTSDCFLKNFSPYFANLFSGTRCDSGKEIEYAEKIIRHYENIKINPMHKNIVFSNSLNVKKAVGIRQGCDGKINCSFGMGNHLGNDFENSPAPNMVIKLWSINGIPTVKLSDDAGKLIGDKDAVRATMWECIGKPLDS
jgi:nicotinate phosphoribosyltransferase